jgi:hypothetical protein
MPRPEASLKFTTRHPAKGTAGQNLTSGNGCFGASHNLQAKRMLSIKRVLPKKTASSSTLFAPTVSTGFNVSASTT